MCVLCSGVQMALFLKMGHLGHFKAQICRLEVLEWVYLGSRYLQQTLKLSVQPVKPICISFTLKNGSTDGFISQKVSFWPFSGPKMRAQGHGVGIFGV